MWIELHDSTRDHPKILKAARDLKISPVHMLGHMASLWTWTLRMAPDGNLESFDDEDIAIASQWEGCHYEFIEVLANRRLLDLGPDGYLVHEWQKYSGSNKSAKRTREYRARRKEKQVLAAPCDVTKRDGDVTVTQHHGDITQKERKTERKKDTVAQPVDPTGPVFDVFAHWVETMNEYRRSNGRRVVKRNPLTSKSANYKKIKIALADYEVSDLCSAIDGMFLTDHNRGKNDSNTEYFGVHIAMDAGNIERFIDKASTGGRAENRKTGFSDENTNWNVDPETGAPL